ATVSPRAWIYTPNAAAGAYFWFSPEQSSRIYSILAINPEDEVMRKIEDFLIPDSRFLTKYDRYSCLISEGFAKNYTQEFGKSLDIGSNISVWGINFTVVGIFRDSLYDGDMGVLDLDQESITPVLPIASGGVIAAVPPHVTAKNTMIIPYETAWSIFPFLQPVAISVVPYNKNQSQVDEVVRELAYRLNVDIVSGKSSTNHQSEIPQVLHYRTRTWINVVGAETLIIPIAISGLNILVMMLGAIYERVKEVKIFTVVGLTPTDIAGLFFMEAITYSLIASIMGYVAGVITITALVRLNFYPPGFFPNYASVFVFLAILITFGMTLASTLYPATKASHLVIPSLQRRWTVPLPSGDFWQIPLPFIAMSESEVQEIFGFLYEFLSEHGAGRFMLEQKPTVKEFSKDGKVSIQFNALLRMAPFDQGIFQDLQIVATESESETSKFLFSTLIIRKSGERFTWLSSNKPFINSLRKQFLTWRTLTPEQKTRYLDRWISLYERRS
ncbi:MAG: FtsX-like permease family protein, partial [Candidatus Bathyarchaeia archaeon]